MSEEKKQNQDRLKGKQDIKNAVIQALRDGATKNNANELKPIIEQVSAINIGNHEQWEVLLRFSDKVVEFRKSGNIEDLR